MVREGPTTYHQPVKTLLFEDSVMWPEFSPEKATFVFSQSQLGTVFGHIETNSLTILYSCITNRSHT